MMIRLSNPTSSACLMKPDTAGKPVPVPATTAGFCSLNLFSKGTKSVCSRAKNSSATISQPASSNCPLMPLAKLRPQSVSSPNRATVFDSGLHAPDSMAFSRVCTYAMLSLSGVGQPLSAQ